MLPIGFIFINVVNLKYERKNPIKGSDGTYKDFKMTFGFALLLFFFSGIVVLRQDFDLDTYCKEPPTFEQSNKLGKLSGFDSFQAVRPDTSVLNNFFWSSL